MSGTREMLVHPAIYNERELHLGDGSDCYACRRHVDAVLRQLTVEDCLANNKQTRAARIFALLGVAVLTAVVLSAVAVWWLS